MSSVQPCTEAALWAAMLGAVLWEQGCADRRCSLVPLAALPPPLRAEVFQIEASSTVIISSDLFSEENGQIEYYGVVATTNDSRKWPRVFRIAAAPQRDVGPPDITAPCATITLCIALQC